MRSTFAVGYNHRAAALCRPWYRAFHPRVVWRHQVASAWGWVFLSRGGR